MNEKWYYVLFGITAVFSVSTVISVPIMNVLHLKPPFDTYPWVIPTSVVVLILVWLPLWIIRGEN